jgi:hypothetical protein
LPSDLDASLHFELLDFQLLLLLLQAVDVGKHAHRLVAVQQLRVLQLRNGAPQTTQFLAKTELPKFRAWSLIRNEKPIDLFERNCHATYVEVRGHCMCKEMPVIPVYVQGGGPKKNNWTKIKGQGGGGQIGSMTPPKKKVPETI